MIREYPPGSALPNVTASRSAADDQRLADGSPFGALRPGDIGDLAPERRAVDGV